jgi:hypothetical protein
MVGSDDGGAIRTKCFWQTGNAASSHINDVKGMLFD